MPLDLGRINAIAENLEKISKGEKPAFIDIGALTIVQFEAINVLRTQKDLPPLDSPIIVYNGLHHYESRCRGDGYTIQDMIAQIRSGIAEEAVVVPTKKMTGLQNKLGRDDGYGKVVKDLVLLELTQKKPKALLFSVIPKGDGK